MATKLPAAMRRGNASSGRLLAVAIVVASCALPAAAHGATVTVDEIADQGRLTFTAAPGEANRLSFEVGVQQIVVVDQGANLTPGAGCTAQGAKRAVCVTAKPWFFFLEGDLGDGEDQATFMFTEDGARAEPFLRGGTGNDALEAGDPDVKLVLDGGEGDDRLSGGRYSDTLEGGLGNDILTGNGGPDRLAGDGSGAPGDDVIDGGAGDDYAVYRDHAQGVTVDLRRATPQGAPSEADDFSSIASAVGSAHDDVLTGNGEDNTLLGYAGEDELRGLGGDDFIESDVLEPAATDVPDSGPDKLAGGGGADILAADAGGSADGGAGADDIEGVSARLTGGRGRDQLVAQGGSADCGRDRDSAQPVRGDKAAFVRPNCEAVAIGRFGELGLALPLKRGKRAAWARLDCDELVEDLDGEEFEGEPELCQSTIELLIGTRVIARGQFFIEPGDQRSVRMGYLPGGRRALGDRPRKVRVEIRDYAFGTRL